MDLGQPYYTQQPKPKRRIWPWIVLAAVIATCAVGGLMLTALTATGAAKSLASAMPSTQPQPTTKATGALGAGDYLVGRDIKAGTYNVVTPDGGINCYWSRVKAFDGDLASVIANGNVQPGQKAKITLKVTDHGLDLQGDCEVTASK